MIKWLNLNSGFTTFLLTFALVIITAYYAYQARKQVSDTHKMVDESSKQIKNTALNYAYLINAEMLSHKIFFVNRIYHSYIDVAVGRLLGGLTSKDIEKLNLNTWSLIKSEIPKYYSSNLMQELVGYYAGMEAIISNKYNESEITEIIKGQFISMNTCINIINKEFNINLRKIDVFDFNGIKYKIDTETGELVEINS